MSAQAHVQPVLWFDLDEQNQFLSRIKRTLLLSLVLHLVVLLIAAGLRLPQRGERPLASVEVALVSLPTPIKQVDAHKQVEVQKRVEIPKPAEPRSAPLPVPVVKQEAAEPRPVPVPVMKHEAVLPIPKAAPIPTPALPTPAVPVPVVAPLTPAPVPVVPSPRQSVAKDILRDIELPPDAPKLGDFTPTKTVEPPRPAAKKKPKMPDMPNIPDLVAEQDIKPLQPAMPAPARQAPLSDRLDKELQEELMKVKQFQPAAKLDIPKETPVKLAPLQEASVPPVTVPQTMLKTSGSSGTNPFWAKVQMIIQNQWEPPPIDVTGSTYRVVVKFRFFRNGTVKDVGIQQTSGNGYFDDAGRRAVLKPRAFPPFPTDMTEAYQDVEMLFQVGEAVG